MDKRQKEIFEKARNLFHEGLAIDVVLAVLRRDDCSKLEAVVALWKGVGMDLKDAKRSVHESPAWADVWERDEFILDDELP